MKSKYQAFYQRVQIRADEAFELSNAVNIQFPNPGQIKQNIFSTLASMMKTQNNYPKCQLNKCLVPIPNQLFLMAYGNRIVLYKHWQTDSQQLQCQIQAQLQLSYYIKTIKISPYHACKKGKDFMFLVEDTSSNYLEILEYDVSNKKLKTIKLQKIPSQINCWSYIQNHEILIWCHNMKLYHYEIKNYGLKLIQTLDSGIKLNEQIIVQDQLKRTKSRNKSKEHKFTTKLGTVSEQGQKMLPFTLNFSTIIGQRGKQQDSVIVLFYVLYNEQLNGMKIKCRQIIYPFQNEENETYYNFLKYSNEFPKLKLVPKTHEIISNNTANPQILQTLSIVQADDVFLVTFEYQIIVIQKKFDQYLALDNIYKKNKYSTVSMAYNSNLVSCAADKILELNQIQISENKMHTTMIDFIDLEDQFMRLKKQINKDTKKEQINNLNKLKKLISEKNQFKDIIKNKQKKQDIKLQNKLFSMWISTDLLHEQHRNNIYFVFQVPSFENGQKKYKYMMYLTKHIPKIKKLTNLAHRAKDINDIQNYRKLGQALGINSSQFYYNMWRTSHQNYEQILAFLLKCKSYKKIISQLKNFLRKRSQPATKLLKVIQKIQSITLQILKQQLKQQFLIDYFHVVFLHRKFQVFSSQYQIDERQFSQMVQISLYDLVKKIINKHLFPPTQKPSLWMMEPKQPPKINLIQVLDLFKLPLLVEYDSFLRNILLSYPDNIIQVIDNFPELLPQFPFEQYQVVMSKSISNTKILKDPNVKQKQFFTPLKYEHLINESNFLKNTLNQLYKYYSTSIILKSFDQVLNKSQIIGQKFINHTIIEQQFDQYVKKIKNITGMHLYIVTLDCLVKCNQNTKQQSNIAIQKLCDVLEKHHNVRGHQLEELEVTACLYQLMIGYYIIDPEEISLESVYSEPIQKWIALFFLGNKQQKDLIFTQFMDIFKNKAHFVATLRKFIYSEHCSKIQISFLIDLITHTDEDFQRENQSIIDVIIDGFCAKVQVCDTPDANNFKQRLSSIQMGQQLLIKADKIQKMGLCKRILSIFFMQNTLLMDLMTRTTYIMQQMLQHFFMGKIKQSKVAISNKKVLGIELKQVHNMFELLRYLRENVLFNVSAEELVILYCKKLVQWQQFQQINQFLYNQPYLQNENLSQQEIVQKIQSQILQDLYDDEEKVYYNPETKTFIQNVLSIEKKPQRNLIVTQQRAKMEIVQIFRRWGFQIKLSLLSYMCKRWEEFQQESNRQAAYGGIYCRPIMKSIIEGYSQYLDYKSLQQLYKYFMIVGNIRDNPTTKTDQFYHYCTKLGDRLMALGRLRQASEIICIVNQRFQMNYRLMAECMLNSLIYIYLQKKQKNNLQSQIDIEDDKLEKSFSHQSFNLDEQSQKINNVAKKKNYHKEMFNLTPIIPNSADSSIYSQDFKQCSPLVIIKQYIDYFAFNWIQSKEQNMQEIFSDFFQSQLEGFQVQQFSVCSSICFKQHHHKLKTDYLWKICQQICSQIDHSNDNRILIYSYFFLLMGLIQPEVGFSLIDYISYNHHMLVAFLNKFKDRCDKQSQLYFIDYSIIFQRYLDSLTTLLIESQQQQNNIESENDSKKKIDYSLSKQSIQQPSRIQTKPNLKVVRQLVKKGEYKNDPLAILINKMAGFTQQAHRNTKRRLITYSNQINTKKFDLSMSMRAKNKKKAEKSPQVEPIVIHEQHQSSECDKPLMMSFDQFKKMKNRIKNDKSLSKNLQPGLDITERLIVEQIFVLGQNGYKKQTSRREIPGLRQLISVSIKEMDQKQKQDKQKQVLIQSLNHINKQQDRQKQSPRKDYYQDQQILTHAIITQNYSAISNWSTDAILIQTAKNYKNKDITFPMVIKMFHELCVGDHTKIDVLWISQPEHLKIDSIILKKIFTIDYLKSQFDSYAHYESKALKKVYTVIDQLTASEIKQIAFYLNDIAKLQYKKASRDHWLNILAMTAIKKQGENSRQKQVRKQRLDSLINTLTPEFRNSQSQNIIKIFETQQAASIIPYLKQRFDK